MLSSRRGFTLVETLAALAISGMLFVALGGYSIAYMQVAREGEVTHRLQREFVFAIEALQHELRIADSLSPAEAPGNWIITQPIYNGNYGTRNILVAHDPATMTLTLGGRVLSRNAALFTIAPVAGKPERVELRIESVDRLPLVNSANLPVAWRTEVHMRNTGFSPPPADPGGYVPNPDPNPDPDPDPDPSPTLSIVLDKPPGSVLEASGTGNNLTANVTWSTAVSAECSFGWAISPANPIPGEFELPGTYHSRSVGPVSNNTTITVFIEAYDPFTGQTANTGIITYRVRR